ncbi:hypothetical protein DPMN_163253 [Dreissena polymorpha]|uniref:Ig-like domain-containing protein n=2 Tax=Dreissena polymorpha TaxID=45954 RepID=A0A9D4ET43_DREPO|nr:hypothetical protein DPMN_163253 [Dreissena polymorpha]
MSRFIADVDGIEDFANNYHSALTQYTQLLAYDANIRLSGVQNRFTAAQRDLSAAQSWLENKKSAVSSANAAFDNAVRALEVAKVKLEEAKKPFQNALDALEEAQQNVDRLCKIKTCANVCVPGIHCSICSKKVWFVTIYYPCCSFTSCMFSIPDPICAAENGFCYVLRGIAYAALEVAQLALRVPMLVLDAAKTAVSAAQVLVDKSRFVLDIAKVALSMANVALESANTILEDAKIALEAVKAVVRLGFMALNFVIKYSLQSLFVVRNCRYEIGSTKDFPIFYVQCEMNAFNAGFETIHMNINFNDPIQSIWNAAKGTIEMTLNKMDNLFTGTQRREILDKTVAGLYKAMRFVRNSEVDDAHFEIFANKTLNEIFLRYEKPQYKSAEYNLRKQLFTEKCIMFSSIHRFFYDTTITLLELVHDTAASIKNMTSLKISLRTFNTHAMSDNVSSASIGIDQKVAQDEFNMSISDMEKAIDGARENIATNQLLANIAAFADDAWTFVDNEADGANKIMIVNQWIAAMNNVTVEYFDNETCASFLDCAHFAIATLYEQYMAVNVTNQTESLDYISNFEELFILLVGNSSHTIEDVDSMSITLLTTLRQINEHGVFCSKAPEMLQPLQNRTVKTSEKIYLVCNATGDPKPLFWWYKDRHIMSDQHSMTLTILNATIDDAGAYHCVAGNLVANYSFDEASVTVLENVFYNTDDRTTLFTTITTAVIVDDETSEDQDDSVNMDYANEKKTGVELEVVILSALLGLAFICVAVGVLVWRHYISIRARTDKLSQPKHSSFNGCEANNCP